MQRGKRTVLKESTNGFTSRRVRGALQRRRRKLMTGAREQIRRNGAIEVVLVGFWLLLSRLCLCSG